MKRACNMVLGCLLASVGLRAEMPQVELGKPEVVLSDGQFGLHYFPDERISVLHATNGYRVFLTVEKSSVILTGPTLMELGSPRNIFSPGRAGAFDNGYAGVSGVWRQPTGELIAVYHAEDHEGIKPLANGANGFYACVALAVSKNNGNNFEKRGPIISGRHPKDPEGLSDQGVGEPWPLTEPKGQFLYLYYTSHERVDGRGVQICLARCSLRDVPEPKAWKKYFEGNFSEPGLGGRDTPVLSSGRAKADTVFPQVTWLPSQKQFAMFYCVNAWQEQGAPNASGIYLAFSPDGIHWPAEARRQLWATRTTPRVGLEFAWHPTLILDESTSGSDVKGWLYYGYSENWGHEPPHKPHYLVRRSITMHWQP